jgi:assimilatory nitrate reductase catalytic subunit
VLPAAGWGEKEGTFINSERRIGRVKRVAASPGQALADLAIFRLVAEAWGCADMFRAFTSPERVFQLLKQLTAGRPCDIGGIADYAALDRAGGIQWPLPARAAGAPLAASRRLFGDGRFYTASGRARFCFAEPRPLPESPGNRYPFLLLTGRGSSAQWHTGTRTDRSPVLRALAPAHAYVEINPRDARMLAIRPGEMVEVSSRRGSAQVRAFVTSHVQPGQLFMPMHYEVTNRLTFPAFDPHSRQPAYKACAVAIRRLEPWERAG